MKLDVCRRDFAVQSRVFYHGSNVNESTFYACLCFPTIGGIHASFGAGWGNMVRWREGQWAPGRICTIDKNRWRMEGAVADIAPVGSYVHLYETFTRLRLFYSPADVVCVACPSGHCPAWLAYSTSSGENHSWWQKVFFLGVSLMHVGGAGAGGRQRRSVSIWHSNHACVQSRGGRPHVAPFLLYYFSCSLFFFSA